MGFRLQSESQNQNQLKNAGARNLFDMRDGQTISFTDNIVYTTVHAVNMIFFFFLHRLGQTPVAQLADQLHVTG